MKLSAKLAAAKGVDEYGVPIKGKAVGRPNVLCRVFGIFCPE